MPQEVVSSILLTTQDAALAEKVRTALRDAQVFVRRTAAFDMAACSAADVAIVDAACNGGAGFQFAHDLADRDASVPVVLILRAPCPGGACPTSVFECLPPNLPVPFEQALTASVRRAVQHRRLQRDKRDANEALVRHASRHTVWEQIAHIFLTVPDDEMYAEVLEVVLSATESRFGFFGFINADGDLVCPSMTRDIWDKCNVPEKNIVFPQSVWGGLWGRILREGRALLSNEGLKTPEGHIPLEQTMGAPILFRGALIGVLQVANRGSAYSEADLAALQDIASYIAPVLHARLRRGEEEDNRREAEEALRRSEAHYRALFHGMHDTIFMHDLEGRLIEVNEAACARLGYARDELIGMSLAQIDAPEAAALMKERLARLAHDKHIVFEAAHISRDGRRMPVEVSARLLDAGGERAVLSVCRDIGARKQAEEALRAAKERAEAANRDLEEAIGRANRLALEAQMAQAAKSEFLANMSHEIRTPMNGITGMVELLAETNLDHEQENCLRIIRNSADFLLTLINDILDFSKIEAGKMAVESVAFDLYDLVEDITEMLAARAFEKGLEFNAVLETDVPAGVTGDPGRLRQVLTNLMGNAIKFTHEGEVAIRGELESEQEDAVTLRFSVRDTGIGIPPDRLDELFTAFSQVDASTTREFGGTGLGLAISKRLVEAMGGAIGVESEFGHGSTFWFTVQLGKQEVGRSFEPHAALAGKRVAVAVANAVRRQLIVQHLKAWGCEPIEALDGPALLSLVWNEGGQIPIDAAVVSLALPGCQGEPSWLQLCAEVAGAGAGVAAVTPLGVHNESVEFRRAGVRAFIDTPVRAAQLHDSVLLALGVAVPSRAGDRPPSAAPAAKSQGEVRVLLAEDNEVNRLVALGNLDKLGYQAVAVTNGAEAVRELEQRRYDVVLMDIQMPEMDGFEATAVIRDPASRVLDHAVPIIAMTAHAMKGDREACLEAGMSGYVAKPVRPQAFAQALAECLARRPAPASSSAEPPHEGDDDAMATLYDREQALAMLDGNLALFRQVVTLFIDKAPGAIQAIESALDARDAEGVRFEAHGLKGAAASAGAAAMRAKAVAIEQAAKLDELTMAAELVAGLDEEYARFRSAVMGAGDLAQE